MIRRIFIAFYALTVWAPLLTACDLCGSYSIRLVNLHRPGFFLGTYEQFTHFGSLQEDGRAMRNPVGQYLDSSVTQFFAGFQFGERVTVQLNLPWVNRSYRRPTEEGIETGTISGLGDAALLGQYRIVGRISDASTIVWNIQGGLKLPTGNSDRLLEELNESEQELPSGIHGHDLALGSGSVDGLIGTMIYASRGPFFGEAAVHYSMRTEGRIGYRFANDVLWSVKPGFFLFQHNDAIAGLKLALSGEAKGKDTFQGEKANDTGITSLFIGPEASFSWRRNLDASFGADFPVVQRNTSFQAVPDHRFRAAVVWRF